MAAVGVLVPAGAAAALAVVGADGDPVALAGAVALGTVAVAPGVRQLVFRNRMRRLPTRDLAVAAAGVAGGAALLVATSGEGAVAAAGTSVLVVLIAALGGFVAFTLLQSVSAVLFPAVVALSGASLDVTTEDRLHGLVMLTIGLVISTEYDRFRDLSAEYGALFGEGVTPAAAAVGPALVLERVSDSFARLVRRPASELVGRPLGDVVRLQDDEAVVALRAGTATSVETAVDFTVGREHRSGRMSLLRAPRDAPLPDLVLVQLTDTTELVERAEALRRANEALSELAGRASHDLKQPLSAVAGYAETLSERFDRLDRDQQLAMARRLQAAALQTAERLDRMVADARRAGDGLREVSIEDILSTLEPLLPSRGEVALRRRLDVDHVVTDPVMLHTVLGNLVGNAVKYRDGGAGRITVQSRAFDGGTAIVVSDDGVGIPVHDLQRVFDRGVRLGSVQAPGSGTGLADAASAAGSAGAALRALPSSQGARFELWVPTQSGGAEPLSVLLAIADPSDRVLVRNLLRLDDRVRDVGDVDRVEHLQPALDQADPDVLLLDEELVDGAALDVLPELLQHRPWQRVIVTSAADAERAATLGGLDELARIARERGATGFVDRERIDRELLAMLRDVDPSGP